MTFTLENLYFWNAKVQFAVLSFHTEMIWHFSTKYGVNLDKDFSK